MKTITTRITVLPENQPIFSELATEIGIVDEAAGPYIEMRQISQDNGEETLRFDIDEWPHIIKAVGKLIQEIKKLKP
jgi:hypothetical protein